MCFFFSRYACSILPRSGHTVSARRSCLQSNSTEDRQNYASTHFHRRTVQGTPDLQYVQIATQIQSAQQFHLGRTQPVNMIRSIWKYGEFIESSHTNVAEWSFIFASYQSTNYSTKPNGLYISISPAICPSCQNRQRRIRMLCDSSGTCRPPATVKTSVTVYKSTDNVR